MNKPLGTKGSFLNWRRVAVAGVAFMLLAGCGSRGGAPAESDGAAELAPVTIGISLPSGLKPLGKLLEAPAPLSVNSITVEVTAPDIYIAH